MFIVITEAEMEVFGKKLPKRCVVIFEDNVKPIICYWQTEDGSMNTFPLFVNLLQKNTDIEILTNEKFYYEVVRLNKPYFTQHNIPKDVHTK